jgi:hypothetical protein
MVFCFDTAPPLAAVPSDAQNGGVEALRQLVNGAGASYGTASSAVRTQIRRTPS